MIEDGEEGYKRLEYHKEIMPMHQEIRTTHSADV